MTASPMIDKPFSILSLDGGGSKGAFTLGVLKELELHLGEPLCKHFGLIYGTSTGAIIAAYLALGFTVDDVFKNYLEIIPNVMSKWTKNGRSAALKIAADREFGKYTFHNTRCMLAIVATRCDQHRPVIFKSHAVLAHAQADTFVPGFGVSLADCLLASAAASPFFARQRLKLKMLDRVEVTEAIDGGFVANNPSMYALIDCEHALGIQVSDMRLCSIGTGAFPQKKRFVQRLTKRVWLLAEAISLLEETLESNSNSADFIRGVLFPAVRTVRINPTFDDATFTTDLLESDPVILKKMYDYGVKAFADNKQMIISTLGGV